MNEPKNIIRPAARLLKAIGQDLIKDVYAAIVELVKNAYDADSPDAIICFEYREDKQLLLIRVQDHGHGMSLRTVVEKWLVPATDDKLLRKRSEKGRVLQGRKGIGRFSAAILGERVLLETTSDGITTSLILDMEELDNIEFLDELELDVVTEETGKENGTTIEIEKEGISSEEVKSIWNPKQLRKLFVELRGLTAPEEVYKIASTQGFDIHNDAFEMELVFGDFPIEEYSNRKLRIDPFPVLDLFDYKISGKVSSTGKATLSFENQNVASIPPEKIQLEIPPDTQGEYQFPGEIFVDLRVYDRDPDSIENIIKRGLKDPDTGEFVGKLEARRILDEYYGVGVYREQFRIRPYGEQGFDWLDLDKKRVQNPSFRIGHNQIVGFIYVRPEEASGLQEKSARDGLIQNKYYEGLIFVVSQAIRELEARRFAYREKALRGGRSKSIEEDLNSLFDFDQTKGRISKELDDLGFPENQRKNFEEVVSKVLDSEKKKKSAYEKRIRETVAIYQGQATLGKITHVLLHEGRKHIKYISETVPRVKKWAKIIATKTDPDIEEKLNSRSEKLLAHSQGLSFLFKKIEPLARSKRSPKKTLKVEKEIENCFSIFQSEIEAEKIIYNIHLDTPELTISANEIDFITIFSNLIENSIFWLGHNNDDVKEILVTGTTKQSDLVIEFSDTGPGFQGGNLEMMFEPGYSMKPDGSGLGLALVGEAMSRVGGKIEAKRDDNGAMFEMIFEGCLND